MPTFYNGYGMYNHEYNLTLILWLNIDMTKIYIFFKSQKSLRRQCLGVKKQNVTVYLLLSINYLSK